MGTWDLLVIGGGINGAGIARDAAQRGVNVCLVEKDDIGGGTSAGSSRLIHGGLRYLEHGEISLVRESLRERERLLRAAPHLVKPLELLLPIYRHARRGPLTIRAGMYLYDLLSWDRSLPGHRMLDRATALERVPGLAGEGLIAAASYSDCQARFPERLVVENILAARASGACVELGSEVIRINVRERRVSGVTVLDRSGRKRELKATTVVNAAGPWVDRVLATADLPLPKFIGGTRGAHIVFAAFPGMPRTGMYAEASSDGRPFFALPWNGGFLVGTTDVRFDEDPGTVLASKAEIEYLLAEIGRLLPGASLDHTSIAYTFAAVRPLHRSEGSQEGKVTRRHIVRHHGRVARGLYSVIGGKLSTYRSLAEDVVNQVSRSLGMNVSCATADALLPGASPVQADDDALAAMPTDVQERLTALYGTRAAVIAGIANRDPKLAERLVGSHPVIGAEIVNAFEHELADTIVDCLARRTMLALDPDNGARFAHQAIDLMRDVYAWTPVRVEEESHRLVQWLREHGH
jgi:glycerol-3-phosphate dehydrogenase